MHSSVIVDQIAYIRAYAPDFPEEDLTDTNREMLRLLDHMHSFESGLKADGKRKWFAVALREVEEAHDAYQTRDNDRAYRLLESASDNFKACVAGKRMRATQVVSPDGVVKKA